MKAGLVLLTVVLGAIAAAAPLVAADASLDRFSLGLVLWGFAPFALLAAISWLMSAPGLLLTLATLGAAQGLAVVEYLGSSDGQAGLIFLFLPSYMVVAVLVAWGLDGLVRLLIRGIRRRHAG